jgi:hypothetical protein
VDFSIDRRQRTEGSVEKESRRQKHEDCLSLLATDYWLLELLRFE